MPTSRRAIVRAILDAYGRTYAQEAGIRLRNTPAPLYQLLNMALLLSARIPARNAVQAARALVEAGLTTPRKMVAASWQDRVDVITWHGYKRYDESGSTRLGQTAQQVLDLYGGDLRRLRADAGRDPAVEHELLQQFKGIGPVGADIFLREVQGLWDEVYPFADARVLRTAEALGLGDDAAALARHVARKDYPRFVAGLVRVGLAHEERRVEEQAAHPAL